jgi:acetylornithine deacetylase/succinyl-diaminopimelate desuccinylase-like protein
MNRPEPWAAVVAETVWHLHHLIRIDTTNPPGGETAACRYLAAVLQEEGIASTIIEPAVGRASLVARLRGDGTAGPLLLLSHLDVVPAEPGHWSVPPFSGAVKNGFVWGRGAVDTKNLTAWELVCFLQLSRRSAELKRDIILAATADEEIDGELGVGWLVTHRPELLDAECGINEGGGYDLVVGERQFFTCQTAEKGVCRLELRARGQAGHGAVPHDDNAIGRLAASVARITRTLLPPHRTSTASGLVSALGTALDPAAQDSLWRIWDEDGWPRVAQLPFEQHLLRQLRSIVRNTATPTMLRAGSAINVIPSDAFAWLDGRTLPGFTPEELIAELHTLLDPGIQVEIVSANASRETAAQGPLFEAMRSAVARHARGAELVPFMSPGATDSRWLRERGVHMFGFKPVRHEPGAETTLLMHNHDERISVDNVEFGLAVLWDVISEVALRSA